MRTFYEASAAEEEDRRRRRGRGDSAEDGAVDTRSGPFRSLERAQLAAANGQAGGDIWAHRSSKWPSEERERVLLSEQEWPSAERERVVSEGENIDEQ
jgi:hypothetical protein